MSLALAGGFFTSEPSGKPGSLATLFHSPLKEAQTSQIPPLQSRLLV